MAGGNKIGIKGVRYLCEIQMKELKEININDNCIGN